MAIQHDHIFVDLETSSLNPDTGEILEIGVIRTDCKGKIEANFTDKIIPTKVVDPEAARVNGYSSEKWRDAVPFAAAMRSLQKTIFDGRSDKVIAVGHFAEFDKLFLTRSYTRENVDNPFAKVPWICTGQLVWPLMFGGVIHSRKLEAVCDYLQIVNGAPHTAMGDVTATMAVYWALMRRSSSAMMAEGALRNTKYGGYLDQLQKLVTGT